MTSGALCLAIRPDSYLTRFWSIGLAYSETILILGLGLGFSPMQKACLAVALLLAMNVAVSAEESIESLSSASGPIVAERSYSIDDLNLAMVWIKPGTFTMGSPSTERHRERDERQHQVTITNGFWLGACEVTVDQWAVFARVSGYQTEAERGDGISQWIRGQWQRVPKSSWNNPGFAQTGVHPVVGISWNDASEFCAWLTARERDAGRMSPNFRYTLPTEAQWEYACRAGYDGPYFPDVKSLNDEIWFRFGDGLGGILAEDNTHPTGQRRPNAWGLYDVHGNVFEWCHDWYTPELADHAIDPKGAEVGTERVCRGGAWSSYGKCVRSALRGRDFPNSRGNNLGFRPCLADER